jgi:phosphonate transport system substrate-binding protein
MRPLRFGTFLAPCLYPMYEFITRYVGARLGCATELFVGSSYEQLATEADAGFVCGLPYVQLARRTAPPIEPLAAPLLQGQRYDGRPIYFSDVIVHRDSPCRTFADLRGCSWSYNERHSQSGYGIMRHHLVRLGETDGYFAKVVEAGWHERSIRMVCSVKWTHRRSIPRSWLSSVAIILR